MYEGSIGSYNFMMVDSSTIEVWSNIDNDRPESFIFLKEGSVKDEKSFHYEIMAWVAKNVG